MNVHELPMILFTVLAQLSVGTFIALGVIDLVLSRRTDQNTVRRITEPVVYAIGPALVFGLAVSMLHMNDITNMINVIRHVESSWLSREIIFGTGFAGLGFLFAAMQWFGWGSMWLRRAVAAATALVGVALVWAMAQIYASLEAVPAWNTPIVPFHFFMTTIILGGLAVACALMFTVMVRRRNEDRTPPPVEPVTETGAGIATLQTAVKTRVAQINAPTTDVEWRLTARVVQWLAVVAAVGGLAVLMSYPLHIASLAMGDETARASAAVFSGTFFTVRLVLLGVAAVLLSLFVFRTAGQSVRERPQLLAGLITAAFLLALWAEMMGRSLHYDSMLRIGI